VGPEIRCASVNGPATGSFTRMTSIANLRSASIMFALACLVPETDDWSDAWVTQSNRREVNAYAEPVVSLDLVVVIAAEDMDRLTAVLLQQFRLERVEHSLNLSDPDSDLRVQIQTDPRYAPFVGRAAEREVLGVRLPVASIEDVLQGKVWAAEDPTRRASKRQKDLADIARLLDQRPDLRARVPDTVLDRLI